MSTILGRYHVNIYIYVYKDISFHLVVFSLYSVVAKYPNQRRKAKEWWGVGKGPNAKLGLQHSVWYLFSNQQASDPPSINHGFPSPKVANIGA